MSDGENESKDPTKIKAQLAQKEAAELLSPVRDFNRVRMSTFLSAFASSAGNLFKEIALANRPKK